MPPFSKYLVEIMYHGSVADIIPVALRLAPFAKWDIRVCDHSSGWRSTFPLYDHLLFAVLQLKRVDLGLSISEDFMPRHSQT